MTSMTDHGSEWGPTQSKTIEWHEPLGPARRAQELGGLAFLHQMIDGVIPPPPIAQLMNMRLVAAEEGSARFELDPDESQYNPLGAIHGGVICTLLDSVVACAVHRRFRSASATRRSRSRSTMFGRPRTSPAG